MKTENKIESNLIQNIISNYNSISVIRRKHGFFCHVTGRGRWRASLAQAPPPSLCHTHSHSEGGAIEASGILPDAVQCDLVKCAFTGCGHRMRYKHTNHSCSFYIQIRFSLETEMCWYDLISLSQVISSGPCQKLLNLDCLVKRLQHQMVCGKEHS